MVYEARPTELRKGTNDVSLEAVSKALDPDTLLYDLSRASGAEVVASTYDLGVESGSGLIQRLAGQEVEVMLPSQNGEPGDKLRGILEPTPEGGFLLRSEDKVYINPQGTLVAPASASVGTSPKLSVRIQSDAERRADLQVSYLTRGMGWNADYVARLDPQADYLELEGWATVTNTTGIPFENAEVTLVSGSPNRAVQERRRQLQDSAAGEQAKLYAPTAARAEAQEEVGEGHAYRVPAPVTLGLDQKNRVRMLDARRVPIRRDYAVGLPHLAEWSYVAPGQPQRSNAALSIHFTNDSASNLGVPLGAGAIRMYENGRDGRPRYTGAASLGDLPKGLQTSLAIGESFDVTAESRVVKSQRIDKRTVRKTVEIRVRNAKRMPVNVRLAQPVSGTAKVVTETSQSRRVAAYRLEWTLPVPAEGEQGLTFTVDLRGG